jgi:hypothetical protein
MQWDTHWIFGDCIAAASLLRAYTITGPKDKEEELGAETRHAHARAHTHTRAHTNTHICAQAVQPDPASFSTASWRTKRPVLVVSSTSWTPDEVSAMRVGVRVLFWCCSLSNALDICVTLLLRFCLGEGTLTSHTLPRYTICKTTRCACPCLMYECGACIMICDVPVPLTVHGVALCVNAWMC